MPRTSSLSMQRDFYSQLCSSLFTKARVLDKIRSRLSRWEVGRFPRQVTHTALCVAHKLANRCQPKVLAVYWRTLLNGWPTQWRMRTCAAHVGDNICPYCGSPSDKIEHFAICPVVMGQYRRFMPDTCWRPSISHFLILDATPCPEEAVVRGQLLYATYISGFQIKKHGEQSLSFKSLFREAARQSKTPFSWCQHGVNDVGLVWHV